MQNHKWTILYSDHKKNFIHLNSIQKHNPNAEILKLDISNKCNNKYAWKNSDIFIRAWLNRNISKIDRDSNIAIFEWDVFINCALPNIKVKGLLGKDVYLPERDPDWWHWRQIKLLKQYEPYAVGVVPFGVYFMDYEALKCWISSKHNSLYNRNIQNELRVPTILNRENIQIQSYDLPYVCWQTNWQNFDMPGIYHPVKSII